MSEPSWPMSYNVLCNTTKNMLHELSTTYDENPFVIGLSTTGKHVFQLWTSEVQNAWSITISFVNGQTCLMGAGETIFWVEHVVGVPL